MCIDVKIIDKIEKRLLNRKKTFKIMKGLIYFFVIAGITSNIYIYQYGDYAFNITTCLNDFSNKSIIAFVIFVILYFVAYSLEIIILPYIIIFFINNLDTNSKDYIRGVKKSNIILKKKMNLDTKKMYPYINKNFERGDFYGKIMFVPTTIVLFMIYLNNFISYAIIALTIIITIFLFRLLNTLLDEHKNIN